ncbi:MAG TPA: hypothetical protein VL986_09055 [Terracidiphilus sp.]|nr:hypothetical protein [Terracidiphilus sp.]
MNPHSVFLRKECVLPDGVDPLREPVSDRWMQVEEIRAAVFDTMIRQAGWYSTWMPGACSRRAFGFSPERATRRALKRVLNAIPRQFNAAELDSVKVSRYPGFCSATVILNPREIQRRSSVGIQGQQLPQNGYATYARSPKA